MLGGDVEAGGVLEQEFFFGDAVVLELAEFGEIFFAVAAEAGFLDLEIAQLFFVLEEGIELGDALFAAALKESQFERRDAKEPPVGVGERLDEDGFAFGDGLELVFVLFDVVLVAGGIVGREQDGAAGESGFDGVGGRAGFAFRGARTGRELGIGAIGGELGFGEFCGRFREPGLLAGEFLGFALGGAADGTWSHGGSRVAGGRFRAAVSGTGNAFGIREKKKVGGV